ncbi:MAG TPA: YncE family protein [Bryobacteraceae bacterium]|nr:YncE family protein [Bryobacteraceae bacterium]
MKDIAQISVMLLAGSFGAHTTLHAAVSTSPLRLEKVISIDNVKGEFDHLAIDLAAKRLYIAAEDQQTVEVLDVGVGKHLDSIRLFARPHGLVFLPQTSQLFVADGNDASGKFVDLDGPKVVTAVKTALRADSVAFDPATQTIFVANGGRVAKMNHSLVTAINALRREKTGETSIDSQVLEALAVESSSKRLYVNLMDQGAVAVVDRTAMNLMETWVLDGAAENSAMALDEAAHRLYVACRRPPALVVLDTRTGKTVAHLPCVDHADDAYFDSEKKRIYVSGGEGAISVYRTGEKQLPSKITDVRTAPGAKTSLFVPQWNELFVAVPAGADGHARLLIFRVE